MSLDDETNSFNALGESNVKTKRVKKRECEDVGECDDKGGLLRHQLVFDLVAGYVSFERDICMELIEILRVSNKICIEFAQGNLEEWLRPKRPWAGQSCFMGGVLEISSDMSGRAREMFHGMFEMIGVFGDYLKSALEGIQVRGGHGVSELNGILEAMRKYRVVTLEGSILNLILDITLNWEGEVYSNVCDNTRAREHFHKLDNMCCKLQKVYASILEDFLRVLMIVGVDKKNVHEDVMHKLCEQGVRQCCHGGSSPPKSDEEKRFICRLL